MLQLIKSLLVALLRRCGLDVRRASSVPFGNRWYQDIQFFPNGRTLNIVLDVGANVGQTALTVARQFPKCRVYSFEPVPSTFQELEANMANFHNVKAIRCALGSSEGLAKMKSGQRSESNTLVVSGTAERGASTDSIIDVQIDTVDSFCSRNGIEHVSLLKIDTEGYEVNVLRGANRLLEEGKIDFVLAECDFFRRDNEPHGDFGELFSHLSALGFNVVSFYTGAADGKGWVWGDVLFRHVTTATHVNTATSPASGHP